MGQENRTRIIQEELDRIEIDLAQATTASALDRALARLTCQSPEKALEVYQVVGSAKLLGMILTGFERPDADTRQVSAKHLSALLLQSAALPEPLREQITLILSQQHDILLEMIERDLESMHYAEQGIDLSSEQQTLGALHRQLRSIVTTQELSNGWSRNLVLEA